MNTAEGPDQYFAAQAPETLAICRRLQALADNGLPNATCRLYHGAPVWFLGDNPVVGVTARTAGTVQLLFWAGQSFDAAGETPRLKPAGKYKAAEAVFARAADIDAIAVKRWLAQAVTIQWDYPNLRATGGVLKRLV